MKRISKAILLLTIAAILMAGLASCSLTDTLQRLFVGAMDDGTENFDMGVIESGVYTSDFAGMQFTGFLKRAGYFMTGATAGAFRP